MMNVNRASSVITKKFSINAEILKTLSKSTLISWAEQIISQGENYQLTRDQHAFLIGDFNHLPRPRFLFEF